MKLFKKAKKGFTLVELVVVIAVIAILSAVSVGAYFGITTSANNSRCEQEARSFHTALMVVVNKPDSKYTVNEGGLTYHSYTPSEGTGTAYYNFTDLLNDIEDETGIDYAAGDGQATALVEESNPGAHSVSELKYTVSGVYKYITIATGKISDTSANTPAAPEASA